MAIATRLKNMRRQPRAKGAGLEFEPPTKKVKGSSNHSSELNTILPFLDAVSYQRHLTALVKELKRSVKRQKEEADQRVHDAERQKEEADQRVHDAERQKEEADQRVHDAERQKEEADQRVHDAERQKEEADQRVHDAERQKEEADQRVHD